MKTLLLLVTMVDNCKGPLLTAMTIFAVVGDISSAFPNPFHQYESWPQSRDFARMNEFWVRQLNVNPNITNVFPNITIVEIPNAAETIGQLRTLDNAGWLYPQCLIPGVRYDFDRTNLTFTESQ
jgi:hypothetical protein